MPKFDLDSAVRGNFDGLIGKMRAKRLSAEMPVDDEKMNDEHEAPGDADGDQAALESMMGSFDNDEDDPTKKA